jgi:hypothetical protein
MKIYHRDYGTFKRGNGKHRKRKDLYHTEDGDTTEIVAGMPSDYLDIYQQTYAINRTLPHWAKYNKDLYKLLRSRLQ